MKTNALLPPGLLRAVVTYALVMATWQDVEGVAARTPDLASNRAVRGKPDRPLRKKTPRRTGAGRHRRAVLGESLDAAEKQAVLKMHDTGVHHRPLPKLST